MEPEIPSSDQSSFKEKYQELLLKKLEKEVNTPTEKKDPFTKTDFARYIVPAILQFITISATIIILFWTNVFEGQTKLVQAQIKESKFQLDSINSRKDVTSKKYDSIVENFDAKQLLFDQRLRQNDQEINLQKQLGNRYRTENMSLVSSNNRLKRTGIHYYLDAYAKAAYEIWHAEADSVRNKINNDRDDRIEFDKALARELYSKPDTGNLLYNKLRFSALAIECLRDSSYKKVFKKILPLLLDFESARYPMFSTRILELLRDRGIWKREEVLENMQVLIMHGTKIRSYNRMLQISSYAIDPLIGNQVPIEKHFYTDSIYFWLFWKTIPNMTMEATKFDPKFVKDRDIKQALLIYLAICPPCYVGLEADIIRNSLDGIEKFSDIDTLTMKMHLDRKTGNFRLFDQDQVSLFRLSLLPREWDIEDFSLKLHQQYKDLQKQYGIVGIGDSLLVDDEKAFKVKFLNAYNKSSVFHAKWSPKNVRDQMVKYDIITRPF